MAKNERYLKVAIELFTLKFKRERFSEIISSDKSNDDCLHELLNDIRNLDPSTMIEIPNNRQPPTRSICRLPI